MNCVCQNQINERIIEPNSKPKVTVVYTIWRVIDKWHFKKQMNNGRIDTRVKTEQHGK